jgi:hypothetical protein
MPLLPRDLLHKLTESRADRGFSQRAPLPPAASGFNEFVELLRSLFTEHELREFMRFLPHGENLTLALPGPPTSLGNLAFEAATLLQRYGLINAELFLHLVAVRPHRHDDIVRVRNLNIRETRDATLVSGSLAGPLELREPSRVDLDMRPVPRRLGLVLSPVILLGLMLWMGTAVHDARLVLIGLSGTELSYAGTELMATGLAASVRMLWFALAGPFVGIGIEGWGVLPLIALAGTAAVLARRARWRVLLPWLAVLLFVFALGTLFYVHAVGVHHVVKPGLGAEWPCRLGPSLPEQIRFEVCSWLSNDSLVNERRRMALAGLWFWFTAALALAAWVSWGATRRFKSERWDVWYRLASGGLALAHGLLFVGLLVQAPRAYAIAYWGLRYPRVTTVEPACDPVLAEAVAAGTCRVLSVGHDGEGDLVLLHGIGCPDATSPPDENAEFAAPADTIRSVHLQNRQPMRIGQRCVHHTEGTELIPNRG